MAVACWSGLWPVGCGVQVCDQLQDENRSLKQRQDTLTAERATLLQKNEQVRARVEAMIGRLKAMEQGG